MKGKQIAVKMFLWLLPSNCISDNELGLPQKEVPYQLASNL